MSAQSQNRQIFVRLDGRTVTLDVDSSYIIDNLLDELPDSSSLNNGLLYYRGEPLCGSLSLEELEIDDGSTLEFVAGLQGGAKKRKKKNYTTPKKNKHKKKKVKLAVLRYYKVDDNGKITRLRRECEKCGAGVFMANHSDRHYCGNCTTTIVFSAEA